MMYYELNQQSPQGMGTMANLLDTDPTFQQYLMQAEVERVQREEAERQRREQQQRRQQQQNQLTAPPADQIDYSREFGPGAIPLKGGGVWSPAYIPDPRNDPDGARKMAFEQATKLAAGQGPGAELVLRELLSPAYSQTQTKSGYSSVYDPRQTAMNQQKAMELLQEQGQARSKAAYTQEKQGLELEKLRREAAPKADGGTWSKVEGGDGQMYLLNNKTGALRPATVEGEAPLQAKLSPSEMKAQKELTQQDRARSGVSQVVQDMFEQYRQLHLQGSAIDPSQSWADNLWARAKVSAPGQMVGGALGTETQLAVDKIAQARALLMPAIAQATGLSAIQMNTDKELQFYLNAATDPTTGLQANLQALERLDSMYGKPGSGLSEMVAQFKSQLGQPGRSAAPAPAPAPQMSGAQQQVIDQAKAAIAAGKSREAVLQRLQQMGIDPRKVGL